MASASSTSVLPAIALMAFGLIWTAGLTLWPQPGQPLAAVYPPSKAGTPALRAAANAGAQEVLAFGGWPSVVIVQSSAPDLADHLYQSGALLVLRAPRKTDCMR